MSLIPYDPFQFLKKVQKEMDQLFDQSDSLFSKERAAFSVHLQETEDEVVAICKAPGLKRKEEMEIEVNGQYLTIGRKMTSSIELKGKDMYKSQQYKGYYRKTLPLPCPVYGWRTVYSDGELKIHMPKSL